MMICNLSVVYADSTPNAVLQYAPIIEVRSIERKGKGKSKSSNDQWGSSVEIAAGAKNSNIHKAEVKIYFETEPYEPQEVEVSVSGSSADGADSHTIASVLVFSEGGTVTIISGVDSVILTVPPKGITGIFTSSNKTGSITVKAGTKNITIDQKWDYRTSAFADWNCASIFNYNVPEDVSLTIWLDENNPIDKHDLVFEVTRVRYLYINDETWDIEDREVTPENEGKDGNLKLSDYSIFGTDTVSGKQKVTTGTNGKATAQRTVYRYPGNDWRNLVYEVNSNAYDRSVYKHD